MAARTNDRTEAMRERARRYTAVAASTACARGSFRTAKKTTARRKAR